MRPTLTQLSALTMSVLACASGCADDASARGESDALATLSTVDDPSGAEAGDAGAVDGGSPDASPVASLDGGLDAGGNLTPDREAPYFVSVDANGTGCPPGTWNVEISPDGKDFVTTFSSYEVMINDQTPDLTVTKNCSLSFLLHSPLGLSLSVKTVEFIGYTFLEEGVTAVAQASYRFQGSSIMSQSERRTRQGPLDTDFVYRDDVAVRDAVWSPCGVNRELIVHTQIQLRNSSPKRSGYINVAAPVGSTSVRLELQRRACTNIPGPVPVVSQPRHHEMHDKYGNSPLQF